MGNKGISRLLSVGESVETKYFNPYEIPLLTLDRTEDTLAKYQGKDLLFVMVTPKSPFFNAQMQDLKQSQAVLEKRGIQVIGLASNSFNTRGADFEDLKKLDSSFPIFPWVEANGDYAHPIMKYLKKNTNLYNSKMQKGSRLTQDTAKFFYNTKTGQTSYFTNDATVGKILQQQSAAPN